ncbi:Arginase/deacetylase [Ramaria rubella]|nr:Arginase/deacetylase [Ramaria rubella]
MGSTIHLLGRQYGAVLVRSSSVEIIIITVLALGIPSQRSVHGRPKYNPYSNYALTSTGAATHDHQHDELHEDASLEIHSHAEHGHVHAEQIPLGYVKYPWQSPQTYATYPGDNEVTADSVFSGITTFAHLPWQKCLSPTASSAQAPFDIAILGAPYDTSTSYRPGARFGPSGIRAGSRRLFLYGSYNVPLQHNPLKAGVRVVDCGDIGVTPYDNTLAIKQIQDGHQDLLHRTPATSLKNQYAALRDSERLEMLRLRQRDDPSFEFSEEENAAYMAAANEQTWVPISKDGKEHPRIVTLGGDHTIVLPLLRSINSAYGKISVIHFDSHLDTWKPAVFGGAPSERAALNHGTYFYWAAQEGLIKNGSSIASVYSFIFTLDFHFCLFTRTVGENFLILHGAIRTTLSGPADYDNDDGAGFHRIEAREIDTLGVDGIIKKIRDTVGSDPVYLSIDIDSIDPAFAPATGTPETGGWSTRELRAIIRGLDGLHIVSADLVEVAPAYDTNAELTTMAAADVLFEVLTVMTKTPLGKIAPKN